MEVFAKDAVIITPGAPDIAGFDAIRSICASLLD